MCFVELMVIRSRVKPEWRVEGEITPSQTDLARLWLHPLCGAAQTLGEHNGTFEGVQRF